MSTPEMDQWYAVRLKPNCEQTAAAVLSAKGIEYCLPVYKRRSRWSDRYKTILSPVFPGYVFSRFDRSRRSALLSTPGVLHVVSFGGVPVPVDPAEMAAVRAIAESGLSAEPWPYLEAGQAVRIVEGPLMGLSGIVLGLKHGHRLVVNVTMLRRAVSVEVDSDWVHPITEVGRPALRVCPSLNLDSAGGEEHGAI